MMIKTFRGGWWVLVSISILSSCKYPNQYQQINAGNKFSISIPSWLKPQDNLKPGADFQYANRYRNFYAIGTADDKEKVKGPMAQLMNDNLEILKKSMKNAVVSDSNAVVVGGLPGIRTEI